MTASGDPFGFCGKVIADKYRVDALIGEGGFGLVFRAFHLHFEQRVALKCLKVPAHFTAEARQLFFDKFREEGKHLAKLSDHPSITRVYDFGVAESSAGAPVAYLVLEWLEGRDLTRLLAERAGGLPEAEALAFLRPAVDAIGYAHGLGIAHRDLKPPNLYWSKTPRGTVLKVLDFGIAKVMQDGETATLMSVDTNSGFCAFSPRYGAPEQFQAKKYGQTGPWTDVYALGLILVELLAGRPALEGEEMGDYLLSTIAKERPTPRARGIEASDAVEALCARALALLPRDRFANGAEMLAAIDAAIANRPVAEVAWPSDGVAEVSGAEEVLATGAYIEDRRLAIAPAPDEPEVGAPTEPASAAAAEASPAAAEPAVLRRTRRSPVLFAGIGAGLLALGAGAYFMGKDDKPPPGAAAASAAASAAVASATASSAPASPPAVRAIALGREHTCALAGDAVRCWGANRDGRLGDGTTEDRLVPTPVAGLAGVAQIAVGAAHSCARKTSGRVLCWGDNSGGRLGDGTTTSRPLPTPVLGLSGVAEIAVGSEHSCARESGGTVICWGKNDHGQLGDGTSHDAATPVIVGALAAVVEIALGGWHSCARTSDGHVLCWGENDHGQLGDGTTTLRRAPVAVSGLADAVALAVGGWHSCARKADGAVVCWGGNHYGQLGDGTTQNRSEPTAIRQLWGTAALALGALHSCALTKGQEVLCWGDDGAGQLGDGDEAGRTRPTPVAGLSGVTAIALGDEHSCALRAGELLCWGGNDAGQLGDGTTKSRGQPAALRGGP